MIVSARNNFDGTSGFELVNREIAFYGFGAVARAVHKLAQGFGMKSFAYDPYIPADKIKVSMRRVGFLFELHSHNVKQWNVTLYQSISHNHPG